MYLSIDALNRMRNEDAKTFLYCHRSDIGNKSRIEVLSKKIRMTESMGQQKITTRKRSKNEEESFAVPAKVSSKVGKPSRKTKLSPQSDVQSSSSSDRESSSASASDYEPLVRPTRSRTESTRKKEIITSTVVAALDRCQMSNKGAMMVLAPVAAAAGANLNKTNISAATINRRRHSLRASIASRVRENYDSGGTIVTVHYDGKKMKDCTGGITNRDQTINRLAIVASSLKGCKLLAIPKIANGVGQTIADSVFSTLGDWNLLNDVRALCFDTTSSNTGINIGSAPILNTMLTNQVLFLACRHHIAELLLAKAFGLTLEENPKSPNIMIFQRFKKWWPRCKIDFEKIHDNSVINDPHIQQFFPKHVRDGLVKFAREQMIKHHDRADYREFAHLSLLCLGEKPLNKRGNPVNVKAAGAVSRARFMGKTIYSLKMYLLRDQFILTGTVTMK